MVSKLTKTWRNIDQWVHGREATDPELITYTDVIKTLENVEKSYPDVRVNLRARVDGGRVIFNGFPPNQICNFLKKNFAPNNITIYSNGCHAIYRGLRDQDEKHFIDLEYGRITEKNKIPCFEKPSRRVTLEYFIKDEHKSI
ncbi:hypothetical protein HYW74_02280 [Candidatus Pacearchaeota archaeon]|nr:hypothetical protein [Candidatus Pacearchaeota archaeon]